MCHCRAPLSRSLFQPADRFSAADRTPIRLAAAMVGLSLCVACVSESGLSPLPNDQIRARFPPGGVVDAIEVDAIDRLPLRTAELVAPDGRATPASYLHVSPSPGVAFSQRFVDSPYEGNVFGVGGLSPVPADVTGAPQGAARLLAMVSTASIPVPDEVEYRREWRSYRIFLSFGDLPGEVERHVLPAPQPPPGQ
jgi:hypothetical protein